MERFSENCQILKFITTQVPLQSNHSSQYFNKNLNWLQPIWYFTRKMFQIPVPLAKEYMATSWQHIHIFILFPLYFFVKM
jgi:hypothetical protein